MKPNDYIRSSFQSVVKLALGILILFLASPAKAEDLPSDLAALKRGDKVKLTRPAVLYFRDQVFKAGNEGDTYVVLAYRPEDKKVFVSARGTDGKEIAVSVANDCVSLASGTSPENAATPSTAVTGMTPATGVGTPDFSSLEALVATANHPKPFKAFDNVDFSAEDRFDSDINRQKGKTITFTFLPTGKPYRVTENKASFESADDIPLGSEVLHPQIVITGDPQVIDSAIKIPPGHYATLKGKFRSYYMDSQPIRNCFSCQFSVEATEITVSNAPPPQNGAGNTKLQLAANWDTQMQGGSATIDDLRKLFGTIATPARNLDGNDSIKVYRDVTYLMPYRTALATLNLTGQQSSKVLVSCPGFPRDSLYYYAIDGNFEDVYNRMYIVVDRADQVVSVQLVNEAPSKVKGMGDSTWHTYNFVNNRAKASGSVTISNKVTLKHDGNPGTPALYSNADLGWRVAQVDSLLVQPISHRAVSMPIQGEVKEQVRWYAPRPLVELILTCTQKVGR